MPKMVAFKAITNRLIRHFSSLESLTAVCWTADYRQLTAYPSTAFSKVFNLSVIKF